MKSRLTMWLITIAVLLVIDFYVFQAVLVVSRDWTPLWKGLIRYGFWIPTIATVAAISWYNLGDPYKLSHNARTFLLTGIFAVYISKVLAVVVLFIDDIFRFFKCA